MPRFGRDRAAGAAPVRLALQLAGGFDVVTTADHLAHRVPGRALAQILSDVATAAPTIRSRPVPVVYGPWWRHPAFRVSTGPPDLALLMRLLEGLRNVRG